MTSLTCWTILSIPPISSKVVDGIFFSSSVVSLFSSLFPSRDIENPPLNEEYCSLGFIPIISVCCIPIGASLYLYSHSPSSVTSILSGKFSTVFSILSIWKCLHKFKFFVVVSLVRICIMRSLSTIQISPSKWPISYQHSVDRYE